MKLLIFNDAHIRGTTPKSRLDDFPTTLWDKFQQITQIIVERNIEAVLNGGDLFDTPDLARSIVNKYLELFVYWDIPIYSVIGSHDKFGYNNSTLPRTALGTLIAAGAVEIIDEAKYIGPNTQVAGVSHTYDLDEDPNDYFRIKKYPGNYMIQLCHGMITDKQWDYGKHTLITDIKTEANLLISGHYHPGFKPVTINNTAFVNIGSLSRVERTPRLYKPGVLYVNTDIPGQEVWEYIPLVSLDDDKIFVEKEEKPQTTTEVNNFIETLKQRIDKFEPGNLKELIITVGKEGNYSQEVIEEGLKYIENVN